MEPLGLLILYHPPFSASPLLSMDFYSYFPFGDLGTHFSSDPPPYNGHID